MEKLRKIVAVDNIGLEPEAYAELSNYTQEFILHEDYPQTRQEIIDRMQGADGMLVSWHTGIDKEILDKCEQLKYVGMCCSLYEEKSANVDIAAARERNIRVLGVRDYGDQGVVEFIISELIRLLHGYGGKQWKETPLELTGIKVGIIGMGVTGTMVADALKLFGAEVYYYSRTRKLQLENQKGYIYADLDTLLQTTQIITTHLPKHNCMLGKRELDLYGNGKIIVNTSIGPTYDTEEIKKWLSCKENYLITDSCGMGSFASEFKPYENSINYPGVCAASKQMKQRLSQKVLENIHTYLQEQA
ncbi:MAG: NAD(P)-dependent oxidoreductase [Angelakisella sp.]